MIKSKKRNLAEARAVIPAGSRVIYYPPNENPINATVINQIEKEDGRLRLCIDTNGVIINVPIEKTYLLSMPTYPEPPWRQASREQAERSRQPGRYDEILSRIDSELIYLPSLHTAPDWEMQCRNLSPWAWAEMYRTPTYWVWARWGLPVTLKDTVANVDKMYLFALNTLHL